MRVPVFPIVKFVIPHIKWIDEEYQERILSEVNDQVYRAFFLF